MAAAFGRQRLTFPRDPTKSTEASPDSEHCRPTGRARTWPERKTGHGLSGRTFPFGRLSTLAALSDVPWGQGADAAPRVIALLARSCLRAGCVVFHCFDLDGMFETATQVGASVRKAVSSFQL